MHHQQIKELETAIALLEKNPTFGVLPQVEACLTPPLWKVRVRHEPITILPYSLPNVLNPRWCEFRFNAHDPIPEQEYDYARACTYALHWINKEERRVTNRVLFMLKTWLKNERELSSAPPAKAKKRRGASRPVAKQKTAWMGAKSFAKLANSPIPAREHQIIDTKRCLYVTDKGVMAHGLSTLLFVAGETDKEPGVYNAKTGEVVTEPNKMEHFYTAVLNVQRTGGESLTFDGQELFEAMRFIAVMGEVATWEHTSSGVTLTTNTPEIGDAEVYIGWGMGWKRWPQSIPTVYFNIKEVTKAVALMPGKVTVTLYPDGTVQFQGANATAICLPIKKEK